MRCLNTTETRIPIGRERERERAKAKERAAHLPSVVEMRAAHLLRKKIKTMISSALAELVKDNSQTEAFAETLKKFVSSYVGKQPVTATVGAAAGLSAAEKQHDGAVVADGKLQAILDRSKKAKFSK